MKKKEELENLEREYANFLKYHEAIFEKKKSFEDKIATATMNLSNSLIKSIPEVVSSLDGFGVDFLYNLDEDIDEDLISKLRVEVDSTEERYKKYRQKELDIATSLLGWELSTYSDSSGAVNDGDYFEVEVTITSPDGVSYSVGDETCLAVCPNFPDNLNWSASQ